MPDISGAELANLIRNRLKFSSHILPIIMMCAKQPDEETQKIIQSHGVQYLISKPIKPSELKEVLGKLIDNKPLMEEKEISAKMEDSVKNLTSTIIIAEDNKISMLLMRTILSRLLPNANIIEAENGLEVIEAYETHKPDLILMDVQMPELDGLEASRLIREKEMGYAENNTVIIALTAGALKEEEQRCYESGMDGFLTKPVQQSELMEVFTKYLM
jgi:CheY-like chemotaxis protein